MIWIDFVILAAVGLSVLIGLWRGLVKEAFSLATWLAAIWLAAKFAWVGEGMLMSLSAPPEIKIWLARGLVFLAVLIAGSALAWFAVRLVRGVGLSIPDRLLGAVFGFGRGALIVGVGVIVLEFLGVTDSAWWSEGQLTSTGERIAEGIKYYAALGTDFLEQNGYELATEAR